MKQATSVRLPDDLKAKVDAVSKKRCISFSAFIVEIVQEHFNEKVSFDRMDRVIRESVAKAFDDERKRHSGEN